MFPTKGFMSRRTLHCSRSQPFSGVAALVQYSRSRRVRYGACNTLHSLRAHAARACATRAHAAYLAPHVLAPLALTPHALTPRGLTCGR